MNRKLATFLAAVAVLAFALPASASANTPTLFDHAGKVAVGAKILMTSTNWTVQTALGLTKCSKVSITGTVTNNGGGTVRGIGQGSSGSPCLVNGNPYSLTDLTVLEFHTAAAGSGTLALTFKKEVSGILCHFTSAGVPFTYTAGVTNDTIQITNGNLTGTPAGPCEPGILNATLTLETEESGAVWIQ